MAANGALQGFARRVCWHTDPKAPTTYHQRNYRRFPVFERFITIPTVTVNRSPHP